MLVIGAEREHRLPAHWMDSQVPCVHLVNTAPQVTGLFSLNKQSATSSWLSAAILLMLKMYQFAICSLQFQNNVFVTQR